MGNGGTGRHAGAEDWVYPNASAFARALTGSTSNVSIGGNGIEFDEPDLERLRESTGSPLARTRRNAQRMAARVLAAAGVSAERLSPAESERLRAHVVDQLVRGRNSIRPVLRALSTTTGTSSTRIS